MGIELSYRFLMLNLMLRRPPVAHVVHRLGIHMLLEVLGGLGFPVSRPCSPHNSC